MSPASVCSPSVSVGAAATFFGCCFFLLELNFCAARAFGLHGCFCIRRDAEPEPCIDSLLLLCVLLMAFNTIPCDRPSSESEANAYGSFPPAPVSYERATEDMAIADCGARRCEDARGVERAFRLYAVDTRGVPLMLLRLYDDGVLLLLLRMLLLLPFFALLLAFDRFDGDDVLLLPLDIDRFDGDDVLAVPLLLPDLL